MDHSVRLRLATSSVNFFVNSAEVASGNALSRANRECCNLFVAAWLALLSDSPISLERKPIEVYQAFYKRLCNSLRSTVLEFADLAHQMASNGFLMGTVTPSGNWIDGFRETPVFREYLAYYRTSDPALFRYLYTFLNFGKKLDYVDEQFNDTAFRGWQGVEKRLHDLELPECDTKSLRVILRHLLPRISDYDFWPRHGPGAVSERIGRDIEAKHIAVRGSPVLDRVFFRGHLANYGFSAERGYAVEKVIPDPDNWNPGLFEQYLPSKLRFVPKNLKTARSICMEPAELMFFQQGVSRMMQEAIAGSDFGRFIRLRDQSWNQNLALEGSYSAAIDTLDLSAASDSVSFDLVKRVFPPDWQVLMRATRSSLVQTPCGIVSVKKFAPMGSAICFPTQCLIFASIVIYGSILFLRRSSITDRCPVVSTHEIDKVLRQMRIERLPNGPNQLYFEPMGVYGDDICCDSRVTPYVKSILASLGFEVNHGKSFVASQSFRESCGKFYLAGVDVTPLYFRIKGVGRFLTTSQLYSQVHLINASRAAGYFSLASFLQHCLREWKAPAHWGRYAVPFVPCDSESFGIRVNHPVNNHLDRRHSPETDKGYYQRTEYMAWTIRSINADSVSYRHERYSYMRWWASRRDQSEIRDFPDSGHVVPVGYRLQRRWTPLYS